MLFVTIGLSKVWGNLSMNKRNSSKLILIYPFISFCVLILHGIFTLNIVDELEYMHPQDFMINKGLFISFIGQIFMMFAGFVLYGSVRDNDFENMYRYVIIYTLLFLGLLIFSLFHFYISYNYYF